MMRNKEHLLPFCVFVLSSTHPSAALLSFSFIEVSSPLIELYLYKEVNRAFKSPANILPYIYTETFTQPSSYVKV